MKITKNQHDKFVENYKLEVIEKGQIEDLIKEGQNLVEKSTQEELTAEDTLRQSEIEAHLSCIIKSEVVEENEDKVEKGLVYSDIFTIETQVEETINDIMKSVDGEEVPEKVTVSIYRDTQMNRILERVGQEVDKKEEE